MCIRDSVHPVLQDESVGTRPADPAQPAPAPPTQTAPAEPVPTEPAAEVLGEGAAESLSVSQALALGVVGTVGAGLAAAVVRTIRRRRDVQLALRPVGRRILFPTADTMAVESALAVVGLAVSPVPDQGPSPAPATPVPYRPRHAVVD